MIFSRTKHSLFRWKVEVPRWWSYYPYVAYSKEGQVWRTADGNKSPRSESLREAFDSMIAKEEMSGL